MPRRALGTVLALGLLTCAALVLVRVFGQGPPPAPPAQSNSAAAAADPAAIVTTNHGANDQDNTASASDAIATAQAVERQEAAASGTAPLMRVRVIDADEQPIVATVKTFDDSVPSTQATDKDGWCTLPIPVAKQARARLRIEAGERHKQGDFQRLAEVTVSLPWVGSLRGRIVDDERGTPVANAELRRPHNTCKDCEPDSTRSAADGAFELLNVPRQEDLSFVIVADGYPEQDFRLRVPGKGEPVENVFRLRAGVLVTGRCFDLLTKQSIEGAKLTQNGHERGASLANGRLHFLMLPPEDPQGSMFLQIDREGYCLHWFTLQRTAVTDLELPLVRMLTLQGTVSTPAGAPIEGARIRCDNNEVRDLEGMPAGSRVGGMRGAQPMAQSDAQGRFSLSGLPPGCKGRLRVWHEDYQPPPEQRWGVQFEVTANTPPLRVVLHPKEALGPVGSISGTFLVDGKPNRATVKWKGLSREGYGQADDEGTFRLEKVQAGQVELTVVPEEFRYGDQELRERFTAHQTTTVTADANSEVTVTLNAPMATVAGTVRHADGSPAAKHWVYVSKPSVHARAQTDAAGEYTLTLPASLPIVTVHVGNESQGRDVQPGETGVDFVVPHTGTLRYRLRREDGRRDGLQLTARRDGEQWFRELEQWRAPDPDGYRVETLPQGRYTLVAAGTDTATVLRHVQLGDEARVDLSIPAGTTVTVRLAEGMAALPERCEVRLIDQALEREEGLNAGFIFGRSPIERRLRDLTKDNTMKGVGPGRHRLATSLKGIVLEPDHVEVGTEPVTVTVSWRKQQ